MYHSIEISEDAMTCSLCMIVKNEEKTLLRCLESVKGIFDEIIIVDTGSSDGTKDTAHIYTDRVFDFEWCDDFSAARNFAFSKATGDYAMWLDADDVVDEKSRPLLIQTLAELDITRPDMVFMPYNVSFDRNGSPTVSFDRERIVRLGSGFIFEGAIHEAIPPRGIIIRSDAYVSHLGKESRDKGRNLRIFAKLLESGKKLSPRECYYYARELSWSGDTDSAKHYYSLCINDPEAWSENRASCCLELAGIYLDEGDKAEGLRTLLKGLEFGAPGADMCCEIGRTFLDMNDLEAARFWYLCAVRAKSSKFSFVHRDYMGYIPYIQLALICDRLGETRDAEHYNELAGQFKPDGKEYLYNKRYFDTINL